MRTRDLLALIATALVATSAHAQPTTAYPAKPVRVIVAFTAGGTTDIVARAVTQKLAEILRQPFVVENKPGAGGNVGTEYVVRSPPDGYTLIVNTVGPTVVNKTLYRNLPYDPLTDLVPIVRICDVPNVLVVHPDVPAKSFEEFVAYAKAHPGKLSYASTGVGTAAHLSSFTLSKRIGAEAQHIPYKGADGLTDLLAGRTQFAFATIPSVIGFIKAGRLRPLAVNSLQRSRSLPDIPTVAEKGFPDFPSGTWIGFFAPKGTPAAVGAVINKAVNDALPSLDAQLVAEGADPVGGTSAEFAQFVQQQFEKWRTIVRESGASVD